MCPLLRNRLGQNLNGVFWPALTERRRKQERERVDCSHIRGVCRHAEDTYFQWKTMKKSILHNMGPLKPLLDQLEDPSHKAKNSAVL